MSQNKIEYLDPLFGGQGYINKKFYDLDKKMFMVKVWSEDKNNIINFIIPYGQYVLYKEKKETRGFNRELYHINGDTTDDRIENLKFINIFAKDIEVKYPYDPERYYGRRCWFKTHKKYVVYLYLKNEYRNTDMSRKEKVIERPINIYIAETEKLKRFLNDDEKVIFIDGDKTNYDVDNLKIVKGICSKYPQAEVPYQEYRIGTECKNQSGNVGINLYHMKNKSTRIFVVRSMYRYCVKLGRKLERNEKLVYIDGNRLNDDIDNLTHKILEDAEYPFEDYFIGSIYRENRSNRKRINLIHETDSKLNLPSIPYSRYRKQIIEGRIFSKDEDIEVDHIDGNPTNDADDNLQILTVEEHEKKSIQDKKEMSPKVEICCDGCNNNFIENLSYTRKRLNQKSNKSNNIFCSKKCRDNYIRKYGQNNIKYKELIKYTCVGTGREVYIPENSKFLSSKFNPDALPFYDHSAVLKWIIKNK